MGQKRPHAELVDQYRRGELVFDVIDEGPADGPVVVLLHGFPHSNTSWNIVIPRLTARGYRCLAPNQRGFSHGARPTRRRDYRMPELVEDVRALIDASGAQRVHLVGNDFGAMVAWALAADSPERLVSLTTMSMAHPVATPQSDGNKPASPRIVVRLVLPAVPHSGAIPLGQGRECPPDVDLHAVEGSAAP